MTRAQARRALILSVAFVVGPANLPSPAAGSGKPELEWVDQFAPAPNDYTRATNVALDGEGNVFAAGELWTSGDGFLVKYDQHGRQTWSRLIPSGLIMGSGYQLTADAAGNAIVIDTVAGPVAATSNGFIGRYDPQGNERWTRQFGSDNTYAYDVVTDAAGAIYVTGSDGLGGFLRRFDAAGHETWKRTILDGSGTVAVDGHGFIYAKTPGAVHKFDSAGLEAWNPPLPLPANSTSAGGFDLDAAGNLYVVGTTRQRDVILRKYNPDRTMVWMRQFGTAADDDGLDVTVDDLGVIISGSTMGVFPAQTSAGTTDAFVRRFGAAGDDQWTLQFGTAERDHATGVVVAGDRLFVGGTTDGSFPGQARAARREPFVARIGKLSHQ